MVGLFKRIEGVEPVELPAGEEEGEDDDVYWGVEETNWEVIDEVVAVFAVDVLFDYVCY